MQNTEDFDQTALKNTLHAQVFQAYSIIDVLHEILQITQNFFNIEFAPRYGICKLLRHEKIPETHVLATLLTGDA